MSVFQPESVKALYNSWFLPLDARTIVSLPSCPKCNSEYTYEDGSLLICPEC
ncbi:MAG: alkylphosphonate utilization protein, partial [Pseudomonas amygdali]